MIFRGSFTSHKVNKMINRLTLGLYAPLRYVRSEKRHAYENRYDMTVADGRSVFRQADRENQLIQLMRVNLLKRMESPIHSFVLTVEKISQRIEHTLSIIGKHEGEYHADLHIEELDFNYDIHWERLGIPQKTAAKMETRNEEDNRAREQGIMKALTGESMNITEENLKAMRQLFPEAFEEGKSDFDVLRQLLGDFVDDEQERYSFKWNGKGKALRLSQTPSMGTLRPCKEESKDWDNTENLYIEGDNLEVLKLLQKSYYGKVKMIYIDILTARLIQSVAA